MPEPEYLSTAEVARLLGVSVATIKRWVDDGVLPAYKTAGGHRRLLLTDVQRLAQHNHFPRLDPGQLGRLQTRDSAGELHALCPRLYAALLDADMGAVRFLRQIVHQACCRGTGRGRWRCGTRGASATRVTPGSPLTGALRVSAAAMAVARSSAEGCRGSAVAPS